MKKFLLLTHFSLLFAVVSNSQTILSDDCATIFDLGVAPACPDTVYFTNVGATASDIGNPPSEPNLPSCWDEVIDDVWMQFSVPADGSLVDFTVTVTGVPDLSGSTAMNQPAVAIYRGACFPGGLVELACLEANPGEFQTEIDLEGLTPGITYFIRVQDWSDTGIANEGSFQVCVDTLQPINLIDEGGSTSCSGELYDSGGPDGDYSPNENYVFSICPTQPNNCIIFDLMYYNIEDGFTDALTFFDGPTTDPATQILQIGGGFAGQTGGGGVCQTVQASSGCLTVQFQSDLSGEFEGFAGSWQCTNATCIPPETFVVNLNADSNTIINAVSTPQTLVNIDTIICDDVAYGTFSNADNSDLGLSKGLVLTSGNAANVTQPANFFTSLAVGNFNDGDADLDYLSTIQGNGTTSQDACIVELDVFAATDKLQFEYVFGSEEYPVFVGSSFNDIFAFLVSGPGIIGDPNIGNQLNIAVLPDGLSTPVQINSVNYNTNWEYYRNNEEGTTVVYGGLTSDYLGIKKSLTAQFDVIPCNTYHLKLAIADRGDSSYDSGVFISEISGGKPNLSVQFANGIDYFIEDCTTNEDTLVIQLSEASLDTTVYKILIGGTAELGTDYFTTLTSGAVLTFLPGETIKKFPIFPIGDGIAEPTETIEISLNSDFGCGEVEVNKVIVEIEDEPVVEINLGQDSVIVCEGGSQLLKASGAPSFLWTPTAVFNNDTLKAPTITPDSSMWVYVIGTFPPSFPSTCFDKDSMFVEVVEPALTIVPLGPTNICQGDTLVLQAVNNIGNNNLSWAPSFINLVASSGDTAFFVPTFSTTISATVSISGCDASDSQTFGLDPFNKPVINFTDTMICQGQTVDLASDINFTSTSYLWSPSEGLLGDSTASGPLAQPQSTTTYTLVATSPNAYCADTTDVTVEVFPAQVDITPDPVAFLCIGESADLQATTTNGTVTWSPDLNISSTTELNVTVTPQQSTWYFAEMTNGPCTVVDSVFLQIDSLPQELEISAIPDKDFYCVGDTVALLSPIYEPSLYPNITHEWFDAPSIATTLEAYNVLLYADITRLYARITRNNACADTVSFLMQVVDPVFPLAFTEDTICPGESVQLLLDDAELLPTDQISWSPAGSLSCADCPDPIASPQTFVEYTVTGTVKGCSAASTVTIDLFEPYDVTLEAEPDLEIHKGSSVKILSSILPDSSTSTGNYNWSVNGESILHDSMDLYIQSLLEPTWFTLNYTDENGCINEDSIFINILEPMWDIPDLFSPNNDGLNDVYQVVTNGNPNFTLVRFQVFNRWGELVFETKDINEGWDGTYKGKDAPSESYIVVMEIEFPGQVRETKEKDFLLLR